MGHTALGSGRSCGGLEKCFVERCSLGGLNLQNRSQLPEIRAWTNVRMSGCACRRECEHRGHKCTCVCVTACVSAPASVCTCVSARV